MNINHRADISKYEFYDSASKIETFSLKYKTDKVANYPVVDEFYKDNDLFYNDARVKHMSFEFPVQGYTYKYEMEKSMMMSNTLPLYTLMMNSRLLRKQLIYRFLIG